MHGLAECRGIRKRKSCRNNSVKSGIELKSASLCITGKYAVSCP